MKIPEEAKDRISIKQAEHDVKKSIKGFCSNPYCMYCKGLKNFESLEKER